MPVNSAKSYALLCVFLMSASIASAECPIPSSPSIPDGATASEAQLIAAKGAISSFQTTLADYRQCLDTMRSNIDQENEAAAQENTRINQLYNQSVDTEEQIAASFNEAIRAFKAQQ